MVPEQLGPYTLLLTEDCFPLGEDSLALGSFVSLRSGWRVCDLGCGGGTLLLLLARRDASLCLTGVEWNSGAAQAARDNLSRNGLAGTILTGDLRSAGLPNEGFDLVLSNPPYFSLSSGASGGKARSEETCTLNELCSTANRLLKTSGRFAMVYRPERLVELLCSLRTHRLEPKRLQFLAHTPEHLPSAVLVEGVKNGKAGLAVLPTKFHRKG